VVSVVLGIAIIGSGRRSTNRKLRSALGRIKYQLGKVDYPFGIVKCALGNWKYPFGFLKYGLGRLKCA